MKLVRYGKPGKEKPGLIDPDGRVRDLSEHVGDLAGENLSPKILRRLARLRPANLKIVRGSPRLGSCVAQPGNFIAIGLNYHDHANEAGMAIPKDPIIFNKAPNSISGPNDDIMLPKGSVKGDWEIANDTSSWMEISIKIHPRVFDIHVPSAYESGWTANLIEHLCNMEEERHRLRAVLEQIRDHPADDAVQTAANALRQCYHRWLVNIKVPDDQLGRVFCVVCGELRSSAAEVLGN